MKQEGYFVLSFNADGEFSCMKYETKESLEKYLGEVIAENSEDDEEGNDVFVNSLADFDSDGPGCKNIIIKGKVLVPKPVNVVKKLTVSE